MQDLEYIGRVIYSKYIAIAHVQKDFISVAGECLLKRAEQNFFKKLVITLVFKLTAMVI